MEVFRRNAAVALGNSGDMSHLPALEKALEATEDEVTRDTIAWAIEKLS